MKCIECNGRTTVTTTYQNEDGRTKRRRKCLSCGFRFTTREHAESNTPEELDDKPSRDKAKVPTT
jgi:transcriptional regulator NrdR family protein